MKSRYALLWAIVIVLAGIAGYAFFIIHRGFSAKDQPSGLEKVLARSARDLAIPAGARNQKNPLPASADNVHDGLEHFADHCAICHGNDGSGKSDIGQNLYPKPPDLRAAETQGLTDGEIYYIIANGVRLSGMPASDHSPEDNWKLVLFIRHLPGLTPQEEKEIEHLNPNTEPEEGGEGEQQGKEGQPQENEGQTHVHQHHHH